MEKALTKRYSSVKMGTRRSVRVLLAEWVAAQTAELSAHTAELSAVNTEWIRARRAKDAFLANMSHERSVAFGKQHPGG
jgi:hypothetical protein